jgi:hypothetical protein
MREGGSVMYVNCNAKEPLSSEEKRLAGAYDLIDAVSPMLEVLKALGEVTDAIPYGDEPECFQFLRDAMLEGIQVAMERYHASVRCGNTGQA